MGEFLELPLAADYLKWLEISRIHKIDFVDDVVFDYTMHEENISRDRLGRFRCMRKVFETLRESTSDPGERKLIDSRLRTLEIETALVYVREGFRGLWKALLRPADRSSIGERTAALAKVAGEHGPRLWRRRID